MVTGRSRFTRSLPVPESKAVAVFEHRFRVPADLGAVAEFHSEPSALRALTPPPMVIALHRFGAMEEGMEAEFTLWLGPIPIRWKARHEEVGPDGFVDVQVAGPMKSWRHEHRFLPLPGGETEVHDRIEYEHPSGLRAVFTHLLFSKMALYGLFSYRAFATRRRIRKN